MVASLVRFLFTCYEESQTHSFSQFGCDHMTKFSPSVGGEGEGGEKRFLTNSIHQLF